MPPAAIPPRDGPAPLVVFLAGSPECRPQGGPQGRDRHLKLHESRDNLSA